MECHKCKWAANIKVWEHEGVPFEDTPCAKCSLAERSGWTMAFEERRDTSRGPGADDGDGWADDEPAVSVHEAAGDSVATSDAEDLLPVSVLADALRLLLSLPKDALEIIQYRHAGLPYALIAETLGVTEAAVCLRHARLMRRYEVLRELFPDKAKRQVYGKGNGRVAMKAARAAANRECD